MAWASGFRVWALGFRYFLVCAFDGSTRSRVSGLGLLAFQGLWLRLSGVSFVVVLRFWWFFKVWGLGLSGF